MASYVPRAVSALLQGGYWAGLSPDTIYAYSHIAAAIWLAASGVLAMVVVLVLGKRLLPVGVTAARPRPMWCVAWVVGRVMGVLLLLYYLLAVTTVRTHKAGTHSHRWCCTHCRSRTLHHTHPHRQHKPRHRS